MIRTVLFFCAYPNDIWREIRPLEVIDGAFLHHSSLFYQKVVSLHIDVLSFFSDLNKIISWKPLIFENRKKDRYKCLQSRFWIFIHFSLPLLHIYTFLRMNKTWKNKKRTCFEKLIERLIEKLFERLIERLLKAY